MKKILFLFTAFLAAFLVCAPLMAGEADEEEPEEKLTLETLRDRLEIAEDQIEAIQPKLFDIHGFISQGGMLSSHNNYFGSSSTGNFQYHELGLSIATKLSKTLRFGVQFFSRDLGELGNNRVLLDWAFGDWRYKDYLGFRLGRIKMPVGIYNETRDVDSVRTFALLPQSVYSETFREVFVAFEGACAYGNVPVKGLGDFDYQVFGGGGNVTPDSGVARQIEESGLMNIKSIRTSGLSGAALKWNTPMDGLQLHGFVAQLKNFDVEAETTNFFAFMGIPYGTPADSDYSKTQFWTFGFKHTMDDLVISAEHLNFEIDGTFEIPGLFTRDVSTFSEGYYGSVSYRFSKLLEMGSYYAVFYNDVHDKDGEEAVAKGEDDFSAWQKDFCVCTRIDLTEKWIFKVELHWIDGTAHLLNQDNPGDYEQYWNLLVVKTSFTF